MTKAIDLRTRQEWTGSVMKKKAPMKGARSTPELAWNRLFGPLSLSFKQQTIPVYHPKAPYPTDAVGLGGITTRMGTSMVAPLFPSQHPGLRCKASPSDSYGFAPGGISAPYRVAV